MRRVDSLSGLAYAALDAARRRHLIRLDEPGGRHAWTDGGGAVLTRTAEALLQEGLLITRYASSVDVLGVLTEAGERALAAADRVRPNTPTNTKD